MKIVGEWFEARMGDIDYKTGIGGNGGKGCGVVCNG